MSVTDPQTPGVPDHAPKSTGVHDWLARAKKAVVAFLASGVLVGFSDALVKFDFSDLSWGNLWSGLLSGLVVSALVYFVRNQGYLAVDPNVQKTVEQIIKDKFGPGYGLNGVVVQGGQTKPNDPNRIPIVLTRKDQNPYSNGERYPE